MPRNTGNTNTSLIKVALAVLTAFMLTMPSSALAIPGVSVPDAISRDGVAPLNQALEYVSVDRQGSFDEVRSLPEERWKPVNGVRGFGYSDQAFWFRVRLLDLKALDEPVFARLNFAHHDLVHFVLTSESRLLSEVTTGDSKRFGTRPVDNIIFLQPISVYDVDSLVLYVGVATPGPLIVPLELVTREAQEQHDKIELAWFTGYFAIIALIFLNNLAIFSFVRDRTYLYYLSYLLGVGFLIFALRGWAFRYLWPDMPWLNNPSILLAMPLTILLALLFVIRFLDLPRVGDTYDVYVTKALVVLFGILMLASAVVPYHLLIRIDLLCSVLAVIHAFYLGIKYSRRGYRAARLFAVAWFVYLVFVVIYIADAAGWLQPTFITRNAFVVGSALELALLSIAFADRFNQEKKQRIEAQRLALESQQRLNDQLDSLVRNRTRELEQANRQLERLSQSDPLTGLANRRFFDQQAPREFQRARRTGSSLSIAVIDADYFKRVNDNYGHDVGDQCLIAIADAIQNEAGRASDIVARFGGEEIVVLLPESDQDGGWTVAENIRRAIAGLAIETAQGILHVTVSVGVVTAVPSEGLSIEQLMKAADNNLYRAKAEGRNRVVSTTL